MDKIIIIDFGSQLTKLIARRIRDLGVFSEIITISEMFKITDYNNIKGIILSGGPATVTKKKFPSIPIAVISANENASIINRAIGHGASGYIPKSSSVSTLYEAIRTVTDGERWLPPHIPFHASPITEEEKTLAAKIATLTPQQYRVLCYLREGWLNKQIGFELGVTEATIKAHITAIFRKLGVSNRTQAVIMLSHLAIDKDHI